MTASSIRLDGKVAVVTGATKGIGRAIAVALAGAGAAVLGSARNAGTAAEPTEEIGQAGGMFTFVGADVSQWADSQALARRALEAHGRVDILVNNAGTSLPHARLDEIDEAAWREVIGVTLDGTLFMTRALCADEAREITAATIALDRANVAGYSHGKLAALLAGHLARSGAR